MLTLAAFFEIRISRHCYVKGTPKEEPIGKLVHKCVSRITVSPKSVFSRL